jgi:hypothetical protein
MNLPKEKCASKEYTVEVFREIFGSICKIFLIKILKINHRRGNQSQ